MRSRSLTAWEKAKEDIIEEFVRNAAIGLERIKDRADRAASN